MWEFQMMLKTWLILFVATAVYGDESKEVAEAVRAAAPSAAAIDESDWKLITTATAPITSEDIKNQSATVMFMSVPVSVDKKKLEELRYPAQTPPSPSKIAAAVQPKPMAEITFLQPDYIKGVSATVNGEHAKGSIEFEAGELYKGVVQFTARRAAGKWQITEFAFPAYETKSVLGDDGKWKLHRPAKRQGKDKREE